MTEIVLLAICVAIVASAAYGVMKFFEVMINRDRAKARWLLVQDINTGHKRWIRVHELASIANEMDVLHHSKFEPNSEWLEMDRSYAPPVTHGNRSFKPHIASVAHRGERPPASSTR